MAIGAWSDVSKKAQTVSTRRAMLKWLGHRVLVNAATSSRTGLLTPLTREQPCRLINPVQFHSALHGERLNETTPGLLTGYWKWSNSSSSHLETRPSLTLPVQQANVSLQPSRAERVEYFQLPIQEIQVGMRVLAHNPLISDEQRAAFDSSIDSTSWRKFMLDVEKVDGTGNVRVTVLRPSSWLVEEVEATAMALVELGLEEALALNGQRTYLSSISPRRRHFWGHSFLLWEALLETQLFIMGSSPQR